MIEYTIALNYTRCMKQLSRFALPLIFLVIVGVLLLFVFLRYDRGSQYTFTTSSQTVIKEMRKLNRLETASFTIEKVIDAGTNGNRFQQILFGDRILLIAHGEVLAGFDLSKLDEKDISIDGQTLRMTLPPPQILSTSLNAENTRVYDR